MRQRCFNPKNPRFKDYGGRGISVCERWRSSFEAFLSDMGPRPPRASIDRVDNDGNYEPSNCRWATPAEQIQNSRKAKLTAEEVREIRTLVAGGARQADVAKRYGMNRSTICNIVKGRTWL